MKKKKVIRFLKDVIVNHEYWAWRFKKYPKLEKKYVATGEWDDAKMQRKHVKRYKQIISYIKKL